MSRRLIDADAVISGVKNRRIGQNDVIKFEHSIITMILMMPTIDAVPMSELKHTEKERDYWMDKAHSYEQTILRLTNSAGEVPVRHGKWIEVEDSMIRCRCSACGWESHLYEDDVYGMPWCPNCGARMDAK